MATKIKFMFMSLSLGSLIAGLASSTIFVRTEWCATSCILVPWQPQNRLRNSRCPQKRLLKLLANPFIPLPGGGRERRVPLGLNITLFGVLRHSPDVQDVLVKCS